MSTKIEIIPDGGITSAQGFFAGATYAGIKKKSKDALDVGLLFSEADCIAAGLFTANKVKAAPVILDQEKLRENGKARAIVVNSGCANACTGEQGIEDAEAAVELAGRILGVPVKQVLTASTGVIGVNLPMDKVKEGIRQIALSREGGHEFTRAIMTTDTRPKEIAVKVKNKDYEFTIGGTAKGAGMIHPNLATMLSFLTTDAAVESTFLQASLKKAVSGSFNMVSVDGDTSTNDTILLLANGLAKNEIITKGSTLENGFQEALEQVCLYLAKCIARDGEGATRLIEVSVNSAKNLEDARMAARTIVSSPLVKTAVHGCDPNWGRVLAAAGRSGAEVVQDKADVYIGDMCLLKAGRPLPFEKKAAAAQLDREEVLIRLDLNLGRARALAWGCDLSEEYVVINSEYTT